MIHDPTIECICDICGTIETVTPEYKFINYAGDRGYYDCEDEEVIQQLDGWKISDDGKVLCDECA